MPPSPIYYTFFFFNDTATTEIYTLSLHDALPISKSTPGPLFFVDAGAGVLFVLFDHDSPLRKNLFRVRQEPDRKSTLLSSSHSQISYAVFCLKKKKKKNKIYNLIYQVIEQHSIIY